jgi:hypothetical protein
MLACRAGAVPCGRFGKGFVWATSHRLTLVIRLAILFICTGINSTIFAVVPPEASAEQAHERIHMLQHEL